MSEQMKTFEGVSEEGSKRFGAAWLVANENATNAFLHAGVDYTRDPIRYALSLAVYKVLQYTGYDTTEAPND